MGLGGKKTTEQRRAANAQIVGEQLSAFLPDSPKPWWTQWHLLRLNLILLIVLLSSATVGYDGAMMNALQISPAWKSFFNQPNAATLGLINAIYPAGKLCGYIFVAPFSNRYGRKIPVIMAFATCIAGAAIQAGAPNVGVLVFARWLLGFGCALMAQPSPIILTELAYPTHRGKLTALFNTFYYFGAIFAAWLTYGTLKLSGDWGWRIPTLLQAGIPAVQLAFSWFLPESPRYLVAKGKVEEARKLLVYHHAGGDENSKLVEFEIAQIRETLRAEMESEKTSIKHILTGPANRKRVLVSFITGIAAQWSGNAVIAYYLSLVLNTIGITNATDQSLINAGLQIFNWLASVFCGSLLVDYLGRRTLFLWSAAGMCLSYVIWTVLSWNFTAYHSVPVGVAVVPMIFLYYFHYDIALTPFLYSYPTEIFPYELRSWGVAFTLFVSNGSLIIGQFANPIAMTNIGWKYYIVFCVLDGIFFALVWFLFPETKGKSLEEISEVFEGKVMGAEIVAQKARDIEGTVDYYEELDVVADKKD